MENIYKQIIIGHLLEMARGNYSIIQKMLVPHQDDDLGEILLAYLKLHDTTEDEGKKLKISQLQLMESAKLASVGELAAGLAHEIKNPLSAVLTYSTMMRDTLEDFPEEKTHHLKDFYKQLDHIKEAALRCKIICQNLLDFFQW